MADYRSGNRDRARSSIFSDDDRGSGAESRWRSENQGWGGSSGRDQNVRSSASGRGPTDDRGFFERAGDEVRSWFGDEDAERRRDIDARRYEQEGGQAGRYQGGGHDDQWTGGRPNQGDERDQRGPMRSNMAQPGYGQGSSGQGGGQQGRYGQSYGQSHGESGGSFGGSHHDESYRRWREQQIAQLDREYDEYCRHRQQQFEQDFSSFRQNRQSGITSGGPTMSQGGQGANQMGSTEFASSSGATAGQGGTTGHLTSGQEAAGAAGSQQNAGATTTGSGGASAATSSTGSSGEAATAGTGGGRSSRKS